MSENFSTVTTQNFDTVTVQVLTETDALTITDAGGDVVQLDDQEVGQMLRQLRDIFGENAIADWLASK